MREIVLDTETTGLDHLTGDRIVEIGGVELINHLPTGLTFHKYINPQYPVAPAAFDVHGLSNQFLSDKPLFADVAAEFIAFIQDARLVIHNAAFDIGFLDSELTRLGYPPIEPTTVIDTLMLARRKHPGGPNSLDALCARYGIDNSRRTKHGALLDSEILADVYLELIGGRQTDLGLAVAGMIRTTISVSQGSARAIERPEPLPSLLSDAERDAHRKFVTTLGEAPIWTRYGVSTEA
ncbi:DNA polymerase III subunit epsilon [Chelatococcus asaccharovorans]|jgi:DNA polymerase-3 subunit epsilon|uniref:DNA polymerase III subunit epsilon n=1 Tax=Chelatococcus asaccharovorans TaxID=28210 RepID=UPI00224C7718|nr:DNA polymerase III subunit epsilon [Chelatococcus asaccharovorans]CAH1658222.1 DNA polymerase III subunit epsilon [Chelatococcus asaccharovorans]CAH1684567.1 DNA polymerase III subunit epsilon [Chelatococcus asaccharovorans]